MSRTAVVPVLVLIGWFAGLSAASGQATRVTITGDPAQCAASTSVQLWKIRYGVHQTRSSGPEEGIVVFTDVMFRSGPLAASASFVDGQGAGDTCSWTFPVAAPGQYVALLSRPDGSGGSQSFTLADAEHAAVVIAAPRVRLMGRIVRDGTPVSGLIVRVTGMPFSRPAVTASSDADGRYTLWLDRPGLHQIEADRFGTFDVALDEGTNRLEHDLAKIVLEQQPLVR